MNWTFYDCFWSFYCQLHKYLSQNWGFEGHFGTHKVSKCKLDQKLRHKSQMFLTTEFFNFGRKKPENLSSKNGHFFTISDHCFANYLNIFHKTEIQTVILRCLVCLNLNWVKSYDIFWLKYSFLHAWKSIIPGVKYRSKFWYPRRKPAVMFSKWVFFQNSLVMSWAI